MLSWKEIQKKYQNEWVAMTKWQEDAHGDVTSGQVDYHCANRKQFYQFLKKEFSHADLAVRYTGNVQGPFFLRS